MGDCKLIEAAEAKRNRRNSDSTSESSPENLKRLKPSKMTDQDMSEMKNDLRLILASINEVKLSIQTEGNERKKEIVQLKELIEKGKAEWEEDKKIITDKQRLLERRLNSMEKATKRNNIVMSNYTPKEGYGRKLVIEIEALLQEKTEEKVMVETVQRFKAIAGDRLIITMKDFEDKLTVLRKKKSIYLVEGGKMRPIYVNDDLIREDQEIQKKARDICREARKLGKEANIGYKKVFINGKEYKWELEKNAFAEDTQ